MLVLGVCSLKGGVGKTSVTLGLAAAALARELPVLVVDLDPQGDATAGLDILKTRTTIADVVNNPRRRVVEEAVVPSGWTPASTGRVDAMGGGQKLVRLDVPQPPKEQIEHLATGLSKLPHKYKIVLVDCPPNLGGLTRTGLAVSDRALVVAEPGMFAVTAADRALRLIDDVRRQSAPKLQPLGILVNRVRRSAEHDFRIIEMERMFGPLILSPTFKERTVVQQSQGLGLPLAAVPGSGSMMADFSKVLDRALRSNKMKKKG